MTERAGAKEGAIMKWYAGRAAHFYSFMGHYSIRLEDGTRIEIDPNIYKKQFDAYLVRIGVERTSWVEIMMKADHEWNEYCQVMDTFARDFQQWLHYQGDGVYIEQPIKKVE